MKRSAVRALPARRAGSPVAARLAGTAATLAGAALLAPALARAADMNAVNHPASYASGSVVGSAVPSLGAGAVLQTILGLAVVIGLVFACAWLARRLGFQPARRGGTLKVVASVAVGGKESATVVEVGDTWLVLGVAPGNVRLLHTLPAGTPGVVAGGPATATTATTAPEQDAALSGTFGERFRSALGGEVARRLGGRARKDS
ncbi:flagellar biosynthetic protein FliO [Burkholderia gladioli]|uniref:flagellar biosynthetic protein FliO n=1 Tax=Burkholderia gladioli TaxID=28095 RepID=UPI001640C9AC|nr:flagellar biosynthetic protein FliO [Burkholderia gladioli]MBU9167804.1 flagellar biosynthetic protein FliO [Burkholderia gladioli]